MSDFVASMTRAAIRRPLPLALAAAVTLVPAAPAAASTTTTVFTSADSHVSSSSPSRNYGSVTSLKLDGVPTVNAYLKFNPQFSGAVTKATLRVYANTDTATGFDVRRASSSSWSEGGITYLNAPSLGSTVIARSGAFTRGKWISVDVTRAVTASGTLTLGLTTPSSADFLVAARESGSLRAPQLVVTSDTVAPAPTPTPAPIPSPVGSAVRPYDAASPWNQPIGSSPVVDPKSASFVTAISDNNLPISSDPDQYAIPVYLINALTPMRTVKFSGYYSTYDAGDASRVGHGFAPTISGLPIPDNAIASAGTDGQIVLWDPVSGTEYSFWQFGRDSSGNYTATNGYRYHTTSGYMGRFADGAAGRGAGTPYFAGLVRRWEIDQGRIDHALAFAYKSPSPEHRYPASKSDGGGLTGTDLPEGSRLQLDPSLTDADFSAWGLSTPAKTIARAMQVYGMYVIDNSGSSKIYLEDRKTAGWDSSIDRNLVSKIPWSKFRVVSAPAAP